MAGSAKPNNKVVEASYSYGTVSKTDYLLEGTSIQGLFNGVCANEWNSGNVAYFGSEGSYVVVTLNESAIIWRCGTTDWKEKCGKFKIYKYNEDTSAFDIDMSSYSLTPTQITEKSWEIFTKTLPPGKYKFTGTVRIDSEWFIQKAFAPTFIKYNEKYYIPTIDYYNEETKMFNDVTLEEVKSLTSVIDLSAMLTVGTETFTVIDKFREYPFQIGFPYDAKKVLFSLYKSDSELIVGSGDINLLIAKNIDLFKLGYATTISDDTVFVVCSIDNGDTWLTYDFENNVFTLLEDIKIAKVLSYSDMSEKEKEEYENSKSSILEYGIPASSLETINWNLLKDSNDNLPETIKFAYCIKKTKYSDKTYITSLSCQFDARGLFKKMKDTECDIDISKECIEVSSLIDSDIIKINII